MAKNALLISTLYFLIACSVPENLTKQVAGTYRSKDGAVLVLKADSTFLISNLPAKVVNATYAKVKFGLTQVDNLTYKGYWSVDRYTSNDGFELNAVLNREGKETYPSLCFTILRNGFFKMVHPTAFRSTLTRMASTFMNSRKTSQQDSK